MKALKLYAKHLAQKKAQEEILNDVKEEVLRELKRIPDGKAAVDGVEFHRTTKVSRKYAKDIQDILKDLQTQVDDQKKRAEESGKVKLTYRSTFDASIPAAAEADVLGRVRDYQKHFGVK